MEIEANCCQRSQLQVFSSQMCSKTDVEKVTEVAIITGPVCGPAPCSVLSAPLGSVICEFFPAKIRELRWPRWPASCDEQLRTTDSRPSVLCRSVSRHLCIAFRRRIHKVDVFTLEFGARAAEVEHARFNSHISRPTVAARRLPSLKFHSQVALMGRHVAQASRIHARIFPVQHLYSKHARRPLRRVGGLSWNTPIQGGRSHLAIARWCFRRKTTWWLRPREEILRRTRSRRRIWSAFFLMVAGEYSCLLVRI